MQDIIEPSPIAKRYGCSASWDGENTTPPTRDINVAHKASIPVRLEQLEHMVHALGNKLESARSAQHCHCDHLATVYGDLEEFIRTHYPVHLKQNSSAIESEVPRAGGVSEAKVADVLADFRREIVRQGQQTAGRLDDMEDAIRSVRRALEEVKDAQGQPVAPVAAVAAVAAAPPPAVAAPELSPAQLKEVIEDVRASIAADLDRKRKELLQCFDKRLGMAERAVYQKLDARCTNAARSAEERAAKILNDHISNASSAAIETNDSLLDIRKTLDSVARRGETTQDQVQWLRLESAKTPAEVARSLTELQREVRLLSKQTLDHEKRLSTVSNQASLDGAFMEVKDWLLDLEKRAMSKGEMLELVNRFETQFAEIHRDLHTLSIRLTAPE